MSTWTDLRYSARNLLREPAFAAAAILTLGLGIGATTAIFSVVNGVLLRPLPYAAPDRLVSLREVLPVFADKYPTLPVNAYHFTQWRQRCSSFERISALEPGSAALTGGGDPEQVDIVRSSADLFDTLGVRAARGRTFARDEEQAGHDHVVVIADSLWRRRFGSDPAIAGRTIQLDSQPYAVIGVLPPWFRLPRISLLDSGQTASSRPEVFRPLVFEDDELKELMGRFNYSVVARLKRGIAPERAKAELNVFAAQLVKVSGEKVDLRAAVIPMLESVTGKSRRGLWILLASVASVLLIVCVNLASLQLARAERRSRDSAVRSALGATRRQLARQALTETLLIAFVGGVLGIAIAAAGLGSLLKNAPADIPRLDEVRLDATVLLFALGAATVTGVLFGLAPAWRSARVDPQAALKTGGRTMSGAAPGTRLRNFLVAAEVALSVVLLVMAALLSHSFVRLMSANMGFRAPTVLAGEVQIPWQKYQTPEQRISFHDRVLARLESEPGVASAAVVTALPLTGETWVGMACLPGDNRPLWQHPTVNMRAASPVYFRTMGIPLLAGRTFRDQDRGRNVALVSDRVAENLWPAQDAVGRQFFDGSNTYEAIGVVGDVRTDANKPAVSMVYRPYWDQRWAPSRVKLVVRAKGDPRSVAGAIRAAVHSVDPDVPVPELQTMQEVLADSVAQQRFQTLLASAFALTALLLAALGIYSVVAYSVARRRNELGVRSALGACAHDIYRLVLLQSMRPVIVGLLAGIAGALAAGRVLAALLYEVSPRDPATIATVPGVLLAVALAACFVPARRATRIAPLEALHYE